MLRFQYGCVRTSYSTICQSLDQMLKPLRQVLGETPFCYNDFQCFYQMPKMQKRKEKTTRRQIISEAPLCYNDLQAGFSEEGKLNVVIVDVFMDSGMSSSTQFIAAEFTTQLDQGISHTHTHTHTHFLV